MAKNCNYCGAQLPNDAEFCCKCGKRNSEIVQIVQPIQPSEQPPGQQYDLLIKAAELGNVDAMLQLSSIHWERKSGKDVGESAAWAEKAADAGSPQGMILAYLRWSMIGHAQVKMGGADNSITAGNLEKAKMYLELALQNGYDSNEAHKTSNSLFRDLGDCYFATDRKWEAFECYKKTNDPKAAIYSAIVALDNALSPADTVLAYNRLVRVLPSNELNREDNGWGYHMLGLMLMHGIGTQQNTDEAYRSFVKANQLGFDKAAEMLNHIKSSRRKSPTGRIIIVILMLGIVVGGIMALIGNCSCGGRNLIGTGGSIPTLAPSYIESDFLTEDFLYEEAIDSNFQYFAMHGQRLYCSGDYSGLYSMNLDGSDRIRLTDDCAGFISIAGDCIYYVNWEDQSTIYKIYTDGSGRQKLTDDKDTGSITVVDDHIYYTIWVASGFNLFSVKTDGSNRKQLLNADINEKICVVGNRIYYTYHAWEEEGIFTIKTDGGDVQKVCDDSADCINVAGDRIYYVNNNDGRRIYTIKTDGSERKKIGDDEVDPSSVVISVLDNRIYYTVEWDRCVYGLFTIKTDGSERTMLVDDAGNFYVLGNRIYYVCYTYDGSGVWYSINTDGSDRRLVN